MLSFPRTSVVAILAIMVPLVFSAKQQPALAETSGAAGAIHHYDLSTFRRLSTVSENVAADEFGTRVENRFVATAPAASGGGRIFLMDEAGVVSSINASELSSQETERLGEDFDDLGHPAGTDSTVAVGAPGEPGDGSVPRAALPAVVLVEWAFGRFTREVRRVTGAPGSMFGWRVRSTDIRPAESFFASYIVGAPLEARGSRARAGAVYKYDTDTGGQLWKFRGERAGELAGYDLLVVQDTDDDGLADVLVGAPGSRDGDPLGRVYLLSGANGSVLGRFEAPEGALLFGYALKWAFPSRAVPGILVSAPATAKGKKEAVGAVYVYTDTDLDSEPRVLQGRRRDQWFGVSMAQSQSHLFIGSFEGHRKAKKHRRGSVTVILPSGRAVKTIRGKKGGDYFGRALSVGASLAIGAPGAPPLLVPE